MIYKIFITFITYLTLYTGIANAENNTEAMYDTVIKLNKLYNSQAWGCVEFLNLEEPGIQCSGVFIHGNETGQPQVWIPNPSDPRDSVSFSYLRSDIPTTKLYSASGFIYDQTNRDDNKKLLMLYCFYPFDSVSIQNKLHPAQSHGCGLADKTYQSNNMGDFESCTSVAVNTADEWISKFLINGTPELLVPNGCSFSPNHQSGFLNTINVQIKTKSPYWNELITETWDEATAHKIPVIAFFYIEDDLKNQINAIYYQQDYCKMYNKFVPVVILNLDKNASEAFSARKEDQQSCF